MDYEIKEINTLLISNIDNSNLHYWVTDEQEGMTLHIAGTGRMPDYDDTFEGGRFLAWIQSPGCP